MDFNLDKDTVMLKTSIAKYLKEKCPAETVKELQKSEAGFSAEMWSEIAELGWLGLTYEEAYDGFEMPFFNLFVLFQELGKRIFPSPLFTSAVLSGFLIENAGSNEQKKQYLPALIRGETIFTTALLAENGRMDYEKPGLKATENSSGQYLLEGSRFLVPFAQSADAILVVADVTSPVGQGPTLLKVDAKSKGLSCTHVNTITEEKLDRVSFEQVVVPAENRIGKIGEAAAAVETVLARAVILKCAEMTGGLEMMLNLTLDHVKNRHQFGRPLGTLQAVQHQCADLSTHLETSRLIASQAAYMISEGLPCEKEVAMAKAWCSDAYKKSTWIAHQLHGGVGFTEEYDLHLYHKHAKACELGFGDSFFHRARVADELGI